MPPQPCINYDITQLQFWEHGTEEAPFGLPLDAAPEDRRKDVWPVGQTFDRKPEFLRVIEKPAVNNRLRTIIGRAQEDLDSFDAALQTYFDEPYQICLDITHGKAHTDTIYAILQHGEKISREDITHFAEDIPSPAKKQRRFTAGEPAAPPIQATTSTTTIDGIPFTESATAHEAAATEAATAEAATKQFARWDELCCFVYDSADYTPQQRAHPDAVGSGEWAAPLLRLFHDTVCYCHNVKRLTGRPLTLTIAFRQEQLRFTYDPSKATYSLAEASFSKMWAFSAAVRCTHPATLYATLLKSVNVSNVFGVNLSVRLADIEESTINTFCSLPDWPRFHTKQALKSKIGSGQQRCPVTFEEYSQGLLEALLQELHGCTPPHRAFSAQLFRAETFVDLFVPEALKQTYTDIARKLISRST